MPDDTLTRRLQADLLNATRLARQHGYRFHTCRIERQGADKVMTGRPPKRWHEQAQQDDAAVIEAIRNGHTGYIIHCPSSGVTLLDADDDLGVEQLRHKELTGSDPHVHSPSGPHRSHTYVRGVYGTALDPKVKLTAFGPGSFVVTPGEPQVYQGALPPVVALPMPRFIPPAAVRATAAAVAPGMLDAPGMNPPKTIEVARRQWDRLHSDVVGLVRECEARGWGEAAHARLLALTRELAQLAPENAHAALDAWFLEAGTSYVDNRLWSMLDRALEMYPADAIVSLESAKSETDSPTAEIQGFNFEFLDPDAEIRPPEPALYGGFGGLPLFYGSGVHWLQGESESGKSLIALAGPVLDAVRSGGLVLYVDHESTRGDVQERLSQLGATKEELRRVCYVPAAEVEHLAIVSHLVTSGRQYAVMVVDGVTSALSAAGLSGRDEQELTRWVDSLPRRAQMAVCIDHVVKATDQRNGMAIGSQAKKAVVTGAAYEVECTEKFGRGSSGQIVLRVQKDKPGWVRGAGVKKVSLSVVSRPGTFELSVRVATGTAAQDPREGRMRVDIEEFRGQRYETATSLHRAMSAGGGWYRKTESSRVFERYVELVAEYGMFNKGGGSHDPFAQVVPMIENSEPLSEFTQVKPGSQAGNHPGTTLGGSLVPDLVGGNHGNQGTQNAEPEGPDTSSFWQGSA